MRSTKTILKASLILAAILLTRDAVKAQSFSIDWHKVAGGGGSSSNGQFSLSGTIGQHDASGAITGGQYSVTGGFWCLVVAVQTPGAPSLTVTLTPTNTVVVSWPFLSTGFVLEQNPSIGTTNWTSVTNSVSNDGSFKWVVVPASTGNKYYRLKK
jgi:hypothetical protein